MVKDICKKIQVDWWLWVLLYGVKFLFTINRWFKPNPLVAKLLTASVPLLQTGIFLLIMRRWKLPQSWLILFVAAAIAARLLSITSVTNVGLGLLFLGYYDGRRRAFADKPLQ